MMILPSYRQTSFLLFLVPTLLLSFGYYLQFVEGLEPCPLCMTQRICFYLVAIFGLIGTAPLQGVLARRLVAALGVLAAITGLGVAGRQLWLQSLPEDQVPACGPSFEYVIESFPILEAVEIMFRGNGNCAVVDWTFLGVSIAGWSFAAFLALFAITLWQLLRRPH